MVNGVKRIAVLCSLSGIVACGALIGTRDLTYDERAIDSGASGSIDGPSVSDGASGSGGTDAPADSADGPACITNFLTDKANCGRCAHSCLGGECTSGVCQPFVIAASDEPLGVTTVGDYVYFTDYFQDTLARVKKDGTGYAVLTTAPLERAWGVTNDGTSVYVAAAGGTTGGVYKCPAADCRDGTMVRLTDEAAKDLVVKAGVVYFTGALASSVFKIGTDGSNKTTLATTTSPFHVGTDGVHVYFTNNTNNLLRVPVGGGPMEPVAAAAGDRAGGIFVDDKRVYFSDNFDAKPGPVASLLLTLTGRIDYKNPGLNPIGMVADAQYLFWSNAGSTPGVTADGTIAACFTAGCAGAGPVELAKGLVNPIGIAIDDTAVYYTEANSTSVKGAVHKVAKP